MFILSILLLSVFTIFTIQNFFMQIFSLWAVSPRKDGGLSFLSEDVGVVLAISGIYPIVYLCEKGFIN